MAEASARAARWVRQQGFRLATEPEVEVPGLPPDITAMHEEDLMILFTKIISWIDWIEVQYVSSQIDEKKAENDLEKIAALTQIVHKGEKSVTAAKAHIFENEEYLMQRAEAFTAYSRRKMFETIYNSLDRKKFLVSREITRRKYGNE